MKNNKIIGEEQNTAKHCSERKVCIRKWLATLCLSSGRYECVLHGTYVFRAQMRWDSDINDFVTTTQVQVTDNTFQYCATVRQL